MLSPIIAVVSAILVVSALSVSNSSTQAESEEAKIQAESKIQAEATRSTKVLEEISAAVIKYQQDHAGASPTTLRQLVDNKYLAELPVPSIQFTDTGVSNEISMNACLAVNIKHGLPFIPFCNNVPNVPEICCEDVTPSK